MELWLLVKPRVSSRRLDDAVFATVVVEIHDATVGEIGLQAIERG